MKNTVESQEVARWVKNGREHYSKFFVAVEGEKTIGQIHSVTDCCLPGEDKPRETGVIELNGLYVYPEYRKNGIGLGLIKKAENFWNSYFMEHFGTGLSEMVVAVNPNNHAAIGLYEKAGFRHSDIEDGRIIFVKEYPKA